MIAITGTPILPERKNGFSFLPLIYLPRGKANNITAKNLYEIKLAIS